MSRDASSETKWRYAHSSRGLLHEAERAAGGVVDGRAGASIGCSGKSTRAGLGLYFRRDASRVPDEDWVSARVEKARHEREMALAAASRLEDEVKRLAYRVAELEADRVALKNRSGGGRGVRRGREGSRAVARHPVAPRPRGPEVVSDAERARAPARPKRPAAARPRARGSRRPRAGAAALPARCSRSRSPSAATPAPTPPLPPGALARDDRPDTRDVATEMRAPLEAPPARGERVTPGGARVTIVVLCWNRWELTERCLETLKAHTDLTHAEVLVVDNGSTDETPEKLKRDPWVTRPHERDEPRLRPREQRRHRGRADPERDVLLLNNDVEIHQDGWLDTLREAAHSSPDVGIVGCRLVLPDGRLLHAGTYILARHALGPADRRARDRREPVRRDARRPRDRLRLRVHQARGPLEDRRASEKIPRRTSRTRTTACARGRRASGRSCCGAVTLVHDEHGSTSDDAEALRGESFRKSRRTFRGQVGEEARGALHAARCRGSRS